MATTGSDARAVVPARRHSRSSCSKLQRTNGLMTDTSTTRDNVWQQAFGRLPVDIDPAHPPDWLRAGFGVFAVAVLGGPFAGSEIGDRLVEDLAEVVNALESDDAGVRAPVSQGLEKLVEACLDPHAPPTASADLERGFMVASPTEASRVDLAQGQQDAFIRGLRS